MTQYYVYLMTNKANSVLYIGVTSNLIKRVWEHKSKLVSGFTYKYNIDKLEYFESTEDIYSAIQREKKLKNWHKQWKINLINKFNPKWTDLYYSLL